MAITSGVIIGQNWVQLSDAALNDLLFSKVCFIKTSVSMLRTYLDKSEVPFTALKITAGQRSLTVVWAFVTNEKLRRTVTMTANF